MLLLLEGKTIRCYGLHKVILRRQPALLHVSMHVWTRIATPGQAGNRSNHQRRTSTTAHWRKLTGVRFLGRASLPRQAGPTVPQLRLDLVLARCRTAPVFVFPLAEVALSSIVATAICHWVRVQPPRARVLTRGLASRYCSAAINGRTPGRRFVNSPHRIVGSSPL